MTENAVSFLNNCITAGMSLIVALGTWHVTMKKDREKQVEEVRDILNNHRDEYLGKIRDVQDDITGVNATVQTQIALIDERISTLSDRVERHNQVVDRTYRLERDSAVHGEQINVLTNNIEAIRRGQNV